MTFTDSIRKAPGKMADALFGDEYDRLLLCQQRLADTYVAVALKLIAGSKEGAYVTSKEDLKSFRARAVFAIQDMSDAEQKKFAREALADWNINPQDPTASFPENVRKLIGKGIG